MCFPLGVVFHRRPLVRANASKMRLTLGWTSCFANLFSSVERMCSTVYVFDEMPILEKNSKVRRFQVNREYFYVN
jgi:hypothetical protein